MKALVSKIRILADAAKYDASCASSGTKRRDSSTGSGIGSSGGMGICHSYAPDGRCISLLKLLLTNFCTYDCQYCVNRVSSPIERARFSIEEVVQLTLDFYKRNYIEGLFLSSGIIQNADYTMEQLTQVAKKLRQTHDFKGYIHLKTIPEASSELIREAGLYADRLSINIELPSKISLAKLAPEKSFVSIKGAMGQLGDHIAESRESRKAKTKRASLIYAPAGQSTQMIIGADNTNDANILTLSNRLYKGFQMRRVYYSAYSPIPSSPAALPAMAPPLIREHRLYQADWLLRFYGFDVQEIANSSQNGMLDLDVDPKLAWALLNRDAFPVDVNTASLEWLLRVPGIGTVGASRIIQARRFHRLRLQDLSKCGVSLKKTVLFVQTLDNFPDTKVLESEQLKQQLIDPSTRQLSLF